MSKRILTIINPASGKEYPILSPLNRYFNKAGWKWDLVVTQKENPIKAQIKRYDLKKYDYIVPYGGDGTIIETASILANTKHIMFPLQGGTANFIANELKIPSNPEQALNQLITNKLTQTAINTGYANSAFFLTGLIIGPLAQINTKTNRQLKNHGGIFAYLQTLMSELPQVKPSQYIIKYRNQSQTTQAIGILVLNGNISLFPNIQISSQTNYSSHNLVAASIPAPSIASITQSLFSLIQSQNLDHAMQNWVAPTIIIEAASQFDVMAGDKTFKTQQLVIKNLQKSLNILIPNI